MPKIPIFVEGRINLTGSPRYEEWKLHRWTIADGEAITGSTIIAEIECEIALIEHEVFYCGTLRHLVSEGDYFDIRTPIARIECTEEELSVYLNFEKARRICITIEPEELRLIESIKGEESNEDFALRAFREGFERIRP